MTQVIELTEPKTVSNKVKKIVPIEFKKVLVSRKEDILDDEVLCEPKDFDFIELICKQYTDDGLDVMFAYDKGDRVNGIIFYGHFNDGVVI
jgi:hypothetical protein